MDTSRENLLKVTLYSTGCPRCQVLERKLQDAGIAYSVCGDRDAMLSMGIDMVPVLKAGDRLMGFKEAVDWINGKG